MNGRLGHGPCGLAVATAGCAAATSGVVALTAISVLESGLGRDARQLLRFDFAGVRRSPAEVATIATNNAKLAAATLLCAVVAPRLHTRARTVIDVVLAGLLVLNSVLVGLALAAYGTRLLAAAALHLPLEFAALCLAGGTYVQATRTSVRPRELLAVAATCAATLAAAAVIECYVAIGGLQ